MISFIEGSLLSLIRTVSAGQAKMGGLLTGPLIA